MQIRIIKPYNTKGLDADANIFKSVLEKINNKYNIIISSENDKINKIDDIHIYVSNTNKDILKFGKIKMFMINHELFMQKEEDKFVLQEIDYILARNQIGFNWATKFKEKYNFKYTVVLIKFTTNFPIIKTEKIWNAFLHSAGEHHWKQTDSIIKCWLNHPELPLITITCVEQCYRNIKNILGDKKPSNILLYNYLLPYDKYIEIKNRIGIHLCPSIVEGFGHYINEGRKVQSLVITSNLPPMNELINNDSGILINCDKIEKKRNGADLCIITEETLYTEIKKVIDITLEDKWKLIEKGYNDYLDDTKYFEESIKNLFNSLINNY
jgi:hypothetical protein